MDALSSFLYRLVMRSPWPRVRSSRANTSVVVVVSGFVSIGTVLGACHRDSSALDDAPAMSVPVPPSASASAPAVSASASASSSAPKPPLQLLRFHFTSGIHGKEPEDQLLAAATGDRVYAHLAIRNRSGEMRRVTMTFRVAGEKRTTLDLKVEPSWSFRTWGFNTLKKGDTGELSVDVIDDAGNVLVDEKLPIKSKAQTKPIDAR